jgi:hypothetical protein
MSLSRWVTLNSVTCLDPEAILTVASESKLNELASAGNRVAHKAQLSCEDKNARFIKAERIEIQEC